MRLRTELLWAIAIKLVLVLGIKHVFFSQPVGREARAQAVESLLSSGARSEVADTGPAPPPAKDVQHDQRATR